VEEEGGKVLETMKKDDEEVAYAVVQDPVGACLALVPG
jgi:predicted enzyme related to lactoylglutathione lyase